MKACFMRSIARGLIQTLASEKLAGTITVRPTGMT
jgi:hypothetical protein